MTSQNILPVDKRFVPYVDVTTRKEATIMTGIEAFDNWFSKDGGIVVGSAIFLTGTSGAGKTTLSVFLMKILEQFKVALLAKEMTAGAIKEQTKNMNINHTNALIADDETCPTFKSFMEALDHEKPKVLIVDSLQVVAKTPEFAHLSEEDAQYEIIQELRAWTEKNDAALFVIGHNKKDGEFRGANTIMQMFDAHIEMIHHKKGDFRTIAWGQKNRKGPLGMLYYTFAPEGIEFFTEDEWNAKSGDRDLDSIACSVLEGFLSGINSNHPNYNLFYNELVEKRDGLVDQFDGIELTAHFMIAIDQISKKHGLVA